MQSEASKSGLNTTHADEHCDSGSPSHLSTTSLDELSSIQGKKCKSLFFTRSEKLSS